MARPKRGNFATGAEGQARYRKAVQTWLKNKKAATEKANKITSTQKNIEKQKKPTVKKTKAKPVKELAKKKATSATKKTSTPKKTTTTKQTVKATTTKKKPTTTVKPTNQRLKAAKDLAEKGYKGTKKVVGSGVKRAKAFGQKHQGKFQAVKDTLKAGSRQKNPPATTRPQKIAQSINQGMRKGTVLAKKYMKKNKPFQTAAKTAWQGIKADKGKSLVRGGKNLIKGGIAYSLLDAGLNRATKPITNRISHKLGNVIRRVDYGKKPLTLEESNEMREKISKMSHKEKEALKIRNKKLRQEYSKSRKAEKAKNKKVKDSSNKGLYGKYGDRIQNISDKANNKKTDKSNNKKKGSKDLKINKSSDYLGDKKKPNVTSINRTDYNLSTPEGRRGYNKAYAKANKPKEGSARAKAIEKNENRYGKPHVDKLRAKNRDFKLYKQKKMSKEEFMRRYKNSITAQRHKGLRK